MKNKIFSPVNVTFGIILLFIFTLSFFITICFGEYKKSERISAELLKQQYLKQLYSSNSTYQHRKYSKIVKIAIIMSYNINDPCGRPQEHGFVDTLTELRDDIDWRIETYYMDTKINNRSISQIKQQAKWAKQFVIQEVKPDVVITIDDNAFIYVGGWLSKHGYKVYATGLNHPANYYKGIYNPKNTSMVLEDIGLEKFRKFLKNTRIYTYFDKAYILSSISPTNTEYELISEYKKCIQGILPYETVKFSSIYQLERFLKEKNTSNNRYIYMLSIQRCYDPYKQQLLNKLFTLRKISKINQKHLEFTSNCIFSKYADSMISIGPDFFEMGRITCYLMMDYINTGKFIPRIYKPKIYISINFNRFNNDIFFKNIFEQISSVIDKVF